MTDFVAGFVVAYLLGALSLVGWYWVGKRQRRKLNEQVRERVRRDHEAAVRAFMERA